MGVVVEVEGGQAAVLDGGEAVLGQCGVLSPSRTVVGADHETVLGHHGPVHQAPAAALAFLPGRAEQRCLISLITPEQRYLISLIR